MSAGSWEAEIDDSFLSPFEPERYEEPVYREWSGFLNEMNSGRLDDELGFSIDDVDAPFGDYPAEIGHEVTVSDSVDHDEAVSQLDSPGIDIEHSEDSEFYQFEINEFYDNPDATERIHEDKVDEKVIDKLDTDVDLLNIHGMVHVDGEGEKHLIHWDPAVYSAEDGKQKYEEEEGEPVPELNEDGGYVDNTNYELEDGFDVMASTLDDLAGRYKDRGEKQDDNYDLLMAHRWEEMTSTIQRFTETQQKKLGGL